MKKLLSLGILLPALLFGITPQRGQAQIGIGISVNFAPPALPVYEQPPCPEEGYLWTPGYWAWDPDYGYYWVPGVWVAPPQPGLLWTPGYWAFNNGAYGWNDGYWAPQVGYYGGVDYGWGYDGDGFAGGRWEGDQFRYNTAVVRVNTTVIHNVYVDRTGVRNEGGPRASFNGPGGVMARPTARDEQIMHERHFERTAAQTQHVSRARSDPQARFAMNHGAPRAAAMARLGQRAVAATNHPSAVEVRAAQAQSRGAHPGAGMRPGTRPATRPETNRPVSRPGEIARPQSRPETRPPARPESRPMREPRTEAAPRQESRPAPTPVPHREGRPAPTPVPRVESRPAPRPMPQTAPHVESRPMPRPEARPAPRPEERPAPRPEARPESHPAPHPEERPH